MSDRIVVISGGSRGLGLQLAQHFLDAGDSVATFSRSPSQELDRISASSHRERFLYEPLDVANHEAVRRFVSNTYRVFKRIDVLINNAAVVHDGVLATLSPHHLEQMVDVNLKGNLFLSRECLRVMLRQASGRIINISSIVGLRGFSGLVTYGGTKAALIGLTQALAREVGSKGITVNAVAPGYLRTDMTQTLTPGQQQQIVRRTPLGRLGEVEDVVPVVDFLASGAASFITGQVIVVDGGQTC